MRRRLGRGNGRGAVALDAPPGGTQHSGVTESANPRAPTPDIELRRAREAAALRANLLRRKQQQRARGMAEAEAAPVVDADEPPCR